MIGCTLLQKRQYTRVSWSLLHIYFKVVWREFTWFVKISICILNDYILLSFWRRNDYLVNAPSYRQENMNEYLASCNYAYPQINSRTFDKSLQQLLTNGYIIAGKSEVTQLVIGTKNTGNCDASSYIYDSVLEQTF